MRVPAAKQVYEKVRWAACILPPLAFFIFEETPGFSGLNGINAAALIVLSPLVIAIGFAFTALLFLGIGWLSRMLRARSRLGFAVTALAVVGVVSLPLVEGDWRLLVVIELASVPAALLLRPRIVARGDASPVAQR
jgi:hypothetical protein